MAALLLLIAGQGHARAQNSQDYCIKCTGPDETYVCRIVSDTPNVRGKKLLCIMNIARENNHDSCTASAQSTGCSGVLVQYDISGTMPRTGNSQTGATAPTAPAPASPTKTTRKKEPETLVEFTKKATLATKKGIKNAGKDTKKVLKKTGKAISKTGSKIKHFTSKVGRNIKKASKTTLKCLTSLFFNCF